MPDSDHPTSSSPIQQLFPTPDPGRVLTTSPEDETLDSPTAASTTRHLERPGILTLYPPGSPSLSPRRHSTARARFSTLTGAVTSIPSHLHGNFGHTRNNSGFNHLRKTAQSQLDLRPPNVLQQGDMLSRREAPSCPIPFTQSPKSCPYEGGSMERIIYDDPEQVGDDHDDLYSQASISDVIEKGNRKPSSYPPGYQEQNEAEHQVSTVQCQSPAPERRPSFYAHLAMSEEVPDLVPVTTTEEYERYKRGYSHPLIYFNECIIPPVTKSFGAPPPPQGWKHFIHPEGMKYFFSDSPELPIPVLTEAWIFDREIYARLQEYMDQIFSYMKKHDVYFPRPISPHHKSSNPKSKKSGNKHVSELELYPQDLHPIVLVLEFRLSGRIGYYFVSHPTQLLFWLDPFDFTYMLGEIHIQHSDWLVGLQMKRHYWYHNELFPHLYELKEEDVQEIDDMLGFAIGDVLTSTKSTTYFDLETLKYTQSTLQLYDQKSWSRKRSSVGERRVICRIISNFYNQRFLNLFGERGPRINVTQSLHYSEHRRQKPVDSSISRNRNHRQSWFNRILSHFPHLPWAHRKHDDEDDRYEDADPPINSAVREMYQDSFFMEAFSVLMFGGPGLHLRRLRDMTVDQIVSRHGFAKFAEKMVEEWRDITLYATVVLSGDVSFLTIQSVDTAGSEGRTRTNAQRASYFSIMASMATIVFSLLLLRQHREVISISFLANRSTTRWGLESLALMYGLPFALLIWSMVSFFASFAFLWYTSTDYVVITTVSVSCFAFVVVLVWLVSSAYENRPFRTYAGTAARKVRRVGKQVRKGTVDAVMTVKRKMSVVVTGSRVSLRSDSLGAIGAAESASAFDLSMGGKLKELHFMGSSKGNSDNDHDQVGTASSGSMSQR